PVSSININLLHEAFCWNSFHCSRFFLTSSRPCSLALRVFFIFVAKLDKQAVDGCQATGFIKMLFDFLKSYINIFIKKGL
ncbi:hypothetical protein, partial [uncultured Desulfovibrio sp.]|uniref:hypothetical protein n=1 Tax=uncultured Desulfovibrio sp. TaxID=167968 RepID=UPI0026016EA2